MHFFDSVDSCYFVFLIRFLIWYDYFIIKILCFLTECYNRKKVFFFFLVHVYKNIINFLFLRKLCISYFYVHYWLNFHLGTDAYSPWEPNSREVELLKEHYDIRKVVDGSYLGNIFSCFQLLGFSVLS